MFRDRQKSLRPVVILFVALHAFFIAGREILQRWGADQKVLIIGNVLLFLITLASYLITQRGLKNTNPHAFVRAVYAGMMVKLFAGLIAALIYIAVYKKGLNKPALFTLMGIYLVYTFVEVSTLTKLLKRKANG